MFQKCKVKGCKARGIEDYQGYCFKCYSIYLQKMQLNKLNEVHDGIKKLQSTNIQLPDIETPINKRQLKTSSQFIPIIDLDENTTSNMTNTKTVIREDDSLDDTINALRKLKGDK